MDRTHFMDNIFLFFSATLPWKLSRGSFVGGRYADSRVPVLVPTGTTASSQARIEVRIWL
jgi:hypothetical protein